MSTPTPSAGRGVPVLGIDVGGTTIKSALLDQTGRLGAIQRTSTPLSASDPGGVIIDAVARIVADARSHSRIAAVGVAVPGIVDEQSGVGRRSTNLGWTEFPFQARFVAATGLPIALAHDVRAAGDAESRIGAGRGFRDLAVVTIGTGIAAALRLNGMAYTGRGHAGELGHTVVRPGGPDCRCGKHGCLEAIASAGAIVRRYTDATGRSTSGAEEVLRLAALGDPDADRVWQEALAALATGLSQLAALIAPEAIVIGGGLAEAGDRLLEPLRRLMDEAPASAYIPPLLPAQLGQDAGTWGATFAARDLLEQLP